MVRINGTDVNAAGMTLAAYVDQAGFVLQHIAVERNGSIVPRGTYDTVTLADGDTIEIVHFVGGGC